MAEANVQKLGTEFAKEYYGNFDSNNLEKLQNVYRGHSLMILGDYRLHGAISFINKLKDLQIENISHKVKTCDSTPLANGFLTVVTGKIVRENEDREYNFVQVFTVMLEQDGTYFVHNDVLRVVD